MKANEFSNIMKLITVFFPKFQENINDDFKKQIWYEVLGDLDYTVTQIALKKLLSSCRFMPTVAEIRQAVSELNNPNTLMSGAEAWGQVTRAISKHGSYAEKEALNSMNSSVALLVKRMGWKDICMSENIMADRAHFIKLWNEQQIKDKNYGALPNEVKQFIENKKEKQKLLSEVAKKLE